MILQPKTSLFCVVFLLLAHPLFSQIEPPTYEIQLIASDFNDAVLSTLEDGQEIDLLVTGNIAYGILVNTSQNTPGSLKLELAGPRNRVQIENEAPFSVFGGVGSNKGGRLLPPGDYTLTLTPFEGENLSGASGLSTTLNFTVLPIRDVPLTITGYRLINAQTDEVLVEFDEDIVLTEQLFNTTPLAIEAITQPSTVGSVQMTLNGPVQSTKTENKAPYSQFANKDGDFFGQILPAGDYTVCARAFSLANLEGYSGGEFCTSIQIGQRNTCDNGLFTQLGDFDGGHRLNAMSFSLGGKGYLGTGENASGISVNDFWEYDPILDSWTQIADLPNAPRERGATFVIGDKAYAGLGFTNAAGSRELWEYDPSQNNWTQKANFPGIGRELTFSFSHEGLGYVGGGQQLDGVPLFDMYAYDPQTDTWERKADYPSTGPAATASFKIGEIAYVQGGGTSSLNFNNELWAYDFAQDTWEQKNSLPLALGRTTHIGFALSGKGYIAFGHDSNLDFLNDFWEYDPQEDSWTFLGEFCGTTVRALVSFVIGDQAYFGTGLQDAPGRVGSRDFWTFTPQLSNSNVSQETITNELPLTVNTFPNPLQGKKHLSLELSLPGEYEVDFITTDGNILQTQYFIIPENSKVLTLEIPKLNLDRHSILFMRIIHQTGQVVHRIMP